MGSDNYPDGTPAWFRGEDDEIEDDDGDYPFNCNTSACFDPSCKSCGPILAAKDAEIARLRAALERIAASECALAWVCARDALDGAAMAPQKTEET